tara:strand:+ start:6953 stop:7594 length:642 start_codon:yes stop_codon:yes gene_type:complete
MAIEPEDFKLLKTIREQNPEGESCAILGDCHVYGHSLESFKEGMGFSSLDTFDINGNPTHKVDLNEPIDERFEKGYDWIIDSGTLYCCFDPCTVFRNILFMLKENGCVMHTSNLCGFFGRGFYSLSPALFRDFYKINNFNIDFAAAKKRGGIWLKFDPNDTYLKNENLQFQQNAGIFVSQIPNDSLMCCFAKRKTSVPFKKPIPEHFVKTNGK